MLPDSSATATRQPVWERPWVVALTLGFASAFAVYRLRKAGRLAMDLIRSQIAADLHDDVGAAVTQIVLLSEKIRKAAVTNEPALRDHSSRMMAVSRGLVDSLSDFVWSIDSGKDALADLSLRMRSYAHEMQTDAGLILRYSGPEQTDMRRVRPEVRRQLYFIFKEAVQNTVRHASASAVSISLESERKNIRLIIADDGVGFSVDHPQKDGNGLQYMKLRAASVGGTLCINSCVGKGTVVLVEIPLAFRQEFATRLRAHPLCVKLKEKSNSAATSGPLV